MTTFCWKNYLQKIVCKWTEPVKIRPVKKCSLFNLDFFLLLFYFFAHCPDQAFRNFGSLEIRRSTFPYYINFGRATDFEATKLWKGQSGSVWGSGKVSFPTTGKEKKFFAWKITEFQKAAKKKSDRKTFRTRSRESFCCGKSLKSGFFSISASTRPNFSQSEMFIISTSTNSTYFRNVNKRVFLDIKAVKCFVGSLLFSARPTLSLF